MPRPKKKPTRQIRVYEDVADLAQQLAGVFKVEVSDLLDDVLRRFLDDKRKEALKILAPPKEKH